MIRTRIARAALIGGIATAAVLGTAGAAFAQQNAGGTLMPGNEVCTAKQYASHQVRGDLDYADRQGVKLKIYKGTTVVANTPSRINSGSVGVSPFTGPGNYQLCATNTGTTQTTIFGFDANFALSASLPGLHLRTDSDY